MPVAQVLSHTKHGLNVAFVSVTGELDLATAPSLERKLSRCQKEAKLVVLDLRELSFIDSSGVRAIMKEATRARAAGGRLVVLRGPSDVDRVFGLMGVVDEVETYDLDLSEPPVQVILQLARSAAA